MADIRIVGLDESVTAEDVEAAIRRTTAGSGRVGKMSGDNGKQVGGGGAIVSGMDVREGPPTGSTSPIVLAVHGEGPERTAMHGRVPP